VSETGPTDATRTTLPDGDRTQPDTSIRFPSGTVLARRYRIVGPLGKGGMGEVYRADDLKLRQEVALKFLPASLTADPLRLARLHDEVRLARRVTHPNVCRVHDIVEADGLQFITMELVQGEDLVSLLRRIGSSRSRARSASASPPLTSAASCTAI
jgi:serine/threonine-protein kinase